MMQRRLLINLNTLSFKGIHLDPSYENNERTYEAGLREGRIRGIEETIVTHSARLDKHETRLTSQERITYALLGAIALIEILPTLQKLIVV